MSLSEILQQRFPDAVMRSSPADSDVVVQDDGSGPYIAAWNEGKLGPQPTEDDLAEWLAEYTAPLAPVHVDGVVFLQRFTPSEYQNITAAARTNAQLGMWIEMLRMRGQINVTGSTALAAKAGVVALALLTSARADEIFSPD